MKYEDKEEKIIIPKNQRESLYGEKEKIKFNNNIESIQNDFKEIANNLMNSAFLDFKNMDFTEIIVHLDNSIKTTKSLLDHAENQLLECEI